MRCSSSGLHQHMSAAGAGLYAIIFIFQGQCLVEPQSLYTYSGDFLNLR